MFDQLKQALERKKAMTEKKQPLSHKGGEVEPGQYPDLGETADYRDLNKLSPEQREKGYTTGKAVPDTKIEDDE
jgi:hypothetical protein